MQIPDDLHEMMSLQDEMKIPLLFTLSLNNKRGTFLLTWQRKNYFEQNNRGLNSFQILSNFFSGKCEDSSQKQRKNDIS